MKRRNAEQGEGSQMAVWTRHNSATAGRALAGLGKRIIPATAIVAIALGTAACSSSGSGEDGSLQPTGTSRQSVTPQAISSEWSTVDGENFTIGVPESYEKQVVTASNGTKAHVFDAPGTEGEGAALQRVAVMRDEEPAQDVIQQSLVLEEMQSIENEDAVRRAEVKWPGVERAVLVQWTNPLEGADGGLQQTWQLMAEIRPDLILNVVAIGPEETFEETDLPEILATFKGQ